MLLTKYVCMLVFIMAKVYIAPTPWERVDANRNFRRRESHILSYHANNRAFRRAFKC